MSADADTATTGLSRRDLERATGAEVRAAVRAGHWRRATHGLARGFVQANLAILPKNDAAGFLQFCKRNPKACPILDVTAPGDWEACRAAPSSDLRTDLPGYRIYRDGTVAGEVSDLRRHWRSDHVAFLLGCSNSMDDALLAAGIPQRHLETEDGRLSVYTTSIACRPAGRFHGPLAVSMRPIPREYVAEAAAISARYPLAHGGPVHVGDPRQIGIADLSAVNGAAITRRAPAKCRCSGPAG